MDYKEAYVEHLKRDALYFYGSVGSEVEKWDMLTLLEKVKAAPYMSVGTFDIKSAEHFTDSINRLVEMGNLNFEKDLPLEEVVKLLK